MKRATPSSAPSLQRHRLWPGVAMLLCGAMLCLGTFEGHAQMPLTKEQRRKRAQMLRQVKCLKRCQDRHYKRFYRCGHGKAVECNIRTWLSYRTCITNCHVDWFCKAFRRGVNKRCGGLCLAEARKKRKFKCRRYRTKRDRKRCRRRYYSWRKRSRHACRRVCKTLIHHCNAGISNKLPPPTPFPKFSR